MPAQPHRPSIAAVTLAHISVDMQTGSLVVLLPILLANFDLSYATAAAIITANNIVIAIAQPLFGILGDQKSYKWMVWAGCLLCGAAMASVLFLPSYGLVIAAVILSGVGSAAFHPEGLSRVRAVSAEKVASGTSFFFSGGNIGFALGPIVATLLVERLGKPGALLMLVPTTLGLLALRSQWRTIRQDAPKKARVVGGRGLGIAFGLVAFLMLLITLRSTVMSGLQAFIPLYFHETGTLSKEGAAFLVTLLAICGAAGTLSGGLLADRFGRRTTMATTMVLALGALYFFLHTEGILRMVAIGFAGACLSAAWPIIVVMIQEAMPNNVGLASGLSLGTSYGATGLGVAALGSFADAFGLYSTMTLLTLLPIGILLMTLFVPERVSKSVPQT
ncbi:MAG TPA: MFS transporter [Meiothermus sp.]|nr:MFS transporter [Meiothermus sp.]